MYNNFYDAIALASESNLQRQVLHVPVYIPPGTRYLLCRNDELVTVRP